MGTHQPTGAELEAVVQLLARRSQQQLSTEEALRQPRVLHGLLPALEVLASSPNPRGMLQSQATITAILPRLRSVVETDKASANTTPALTQTGFERMKQFSSSELAVKPLSHRVDYYEERCNEVRKELAALRGFRQLQAEFPGVPVEDLRKRHMNPQPFKEPAIIDKEKIELATAPLVLGRRQNELLQNTPLRAKAPFVVEELERQMEILAPRDVLALLVPTLGIWRDNTFNQMQLADAIARTTCSLAARELSRRLLKWATNADHDSTLPSHVCPCAQPSDVLRNHQLIVDSIDSLPTTSGLLNRLDVRRLNALDATRNLPQQWDSCVACEISSVAAAGSSAREGEAPDSRCCSLQREDYGSERCRSCQDAGKSTCLVPCKNCRDIVDMLVEYIKTVSGLDKKMKVASQITSLLPPGCVSCQQRHGSPDVKRQLSGSDDEDDGVFMLSKSDLDKLHGSESEDSSSDDSGAIVAEVSSRKRARESTSPGSKPAPKRPALRAKTPKVSTKQARLQTTKSTSVREQTQSKEATQTSSGDRPGASDVDSTHKLCPRCNKKKSLDHFETGRGVKLAVSCKSCRDTNLTHKASSIVEKAVAAFAFDQEGDAENFLKSHNTDLARAACTPSGITRIRAALRTRIAGATPAGMESSWTVDQATRVRVLRNLLDRFNSMVDQLEQAGRSEGT